METYLLQSRHATKSVQSLESLLLSPEIGIVIELFFSIAKYDYNNTNSNQNPPNY